MKKFLILFVLIALLFSLVSCGTVAQAVQDVVADTSTNTSTGKKIATAGGGALTILGFFLPPPIGTIVSIAGVVLTTGATIDDTL